MLIEPNTNIRLLHNVPLDNTYDHTIYFGSRSAQTTYFQGLTKYNLTAQSYQRVQRGRARVGIKADSIYDCNYMMFQNTAYGNKWFYAFITSVEFVNNVTSEVTFEIDVMQTWYFDYESEACFVEREHIANDQIGANITDEPVALGEYVMNNYDPLMDLKSMAVIIAIIDVDGSSFVTEGNLYDGVFSGAELWAYDSTDVSGITEKIGEYVQKTDSIVAMYMCPVAMINGGSVPKNHKLSYGDSATSYYFTKPSVNSNISLNGYVPKNMKMYTYPYNFYHVDNANGSGLSLRYEFFENNTPAFEISGTITQPVEVMLRPCSYKGVKGYDQLSGYTSLNTESLTLTGYPLCSWNYDAFQAWIAQNAVPLATNTLANLGELAISAPLSANPNATYSTSIIGQAANVLGTMYKASIASDISKGTFNNGGVNVAKSKQQFYGGQCSVNARQARIIDDFFTMFGYATKEVKTFSLNSRPHWNYIKTIGWCGKGSVPADDMKKIASIYDNGITFWQHGDEVGNYFLDNKPQ